MVYPSTKAPQLLHRCDVFLGFTFITSTLAYEGVLGIGSYAIHWQRARALIRRKAGELRRQWSVFKEGLQLFTDYLIRHDACLNLCLLSDKRLC